MKEENNKPLTRTTNPNSRGSHREVEEQEGVTLSPTTSHTHLPPEGPIDKWFAERGLLNPRQSAFVDHFLADPEFNIKQALLKAGYAESSANNMSYHIMKNSAVQHAIGERLEQLRAEVEVDQKKLRLEYARLAFANMEDYSRLDEEGHRVIDLSNCTRSQLAAVSELTVEEFMEGRGEDARRVRKTKIKLHDKKQALDSLAKHLGFLPLEHQRHLHLHKHQHEISQQQVIEINPSSLPDDVLHSLIESTGGVGAELISLLESPEDDSSSRGAA